MEIGNYIVEKALKLGADDVVCNIRDNLGKQVKFVNNQVAVFTTWNTINAAVFLSYKKRLVGSSLDTPENMETMTPLHGLSLKKENIDKFLEKLIKTAKVLEPKKDYYGIADGKFKYKKILESYDKKIEVGGKEIHFVQDAIDAALEEGTKRSAGVLYTDVWKNKIFSSNGIEAEDKGTSINLSIRSFAEEKDASGHSVSVARTLKKFEPEKAGREAGMHAKQSLNPSDGYTGKYTAILHPMVIANILYYMSYAFSAFEVDSGMSFLIGKQNKKIASNIVNLKDDGRLANGFNSRVFDDEGRPTQTTDLIKNGVFKNFLHNTSTAKKFKTKPTGNAGLIYPQPWNLVLEKGDRTLDEMISEVKDGVYITNVWYTRFANYRTGDFSTIPRDAMFEIKNGRITRPIKGVRITDNMQRILENILAISKNPQQIEWWEITSPIITGHVLVKDLNLTKSAK
jgi:PmbA protein